jgi:hypothetical protein
VEDLLPADALAVLSRLVRPKMNNKHKQLGGRGGGVPRYHHGCDVAALDWYRHPNSWCFCTMVVTTVNRKECSLSYIGVFVSLAVAM